MSLDRDFSFSDGSRVKCEWTRSPHCPSSDKKGRRKRPSSSGSVSARFETLGLSQGFWSDLYHRSMAVSWPVFFGSAAALFVVLNAVFGFLYSLGHEPIANA